MKNWIGLQTKPLKEALAAKLLGEAGMPVYWSRHWDWDGRIHSLFPCYEFVLFDYPKESRLVQFTRGVRRVVDNKGGPIPVEATIIQTIRSREIDGLIVLEEDPPPLEIGDLAEVIKGHFKGFKSCFITGEQRVSILLDYLNFQGNLVVDRDGIRKTWPQNGTYKFKELNLLSE